MMTSGGKWNTYANAESAATACVPCPAKTASAAKRAGVASCRGCRPGLVAAPKSVIGCELCPLGQSTFEETAMECSDCPAGTFQNARFKDFNVGTRLGGGLCRDCFPGTFAPGPRAFRCQPCPKNEYQNEYGATRCKMCPGGSATGGTGAKGCRPTCQPGKPGCVFCRPGEGYNAAKKKCEKCRAGFVAPLATATECQMCPPGDGKANAERTKCLCRPGFRLKKDGQCVACPPGFEGDGSGCVCPYTGLKTGPCRPECPAGQKFNDFLRKCEPDGLPAPCPAGQLRGKRGRCTPCPGGSVPAQDPTFPIMLCKCPGAGVGLRNGKCEICVPGEYLWRVERQNDLNSYDCLPCFEGAFSDEFGATECKRCPAGREPPKQGNTACLPACPAGAAREYSGARCECKEGYAGRGKNLNVVCTKCGENENVYEGKCVCPSGKKDGGKCAPCPPDSSSDSALKICRCDPGFGKKKGGECEKCAKGTRTYFDGPDTKCEPCPPGKVAMVAGLDECRRCDKGLVAFKGIKCLPPCVDGYSRGDDEECTADV